MTDTIRGLFRRLERASGWDNLDTLGKVFRLLAATDEAKSVRVTVEAMDTVWRADSGFRAVYDRFLASPATDADQRDFAAAIRKLLPPTEGDEGPAVADALALYLPFCFNEAAPSDEVVRHELAGLRWQGEHTAERLTTLIESRPQAVFVVASDWQGASEAAVRKAAATDPEGVAALQQALDQDSSPQAVSRLVRSPRPWMRDLHGETWGLLAGRCSALGLWEESKLSWLYGREKPDADWAGSTVRASESAQNSNEQALSAALFAEARADHPDHPRVQFHDATGQGDPEDVVAALNAIDGADPDTAIQVELARAAAFTLLERFSDAHESLAAAKAQSGVESPAYRYALLAVRLRETAGDTQQGARDCVRYAAESIDLETALLQRNLVEAAAVARNYALGFLTSVGDESGTGKLLDEAVGIYQDAPEAARITLAVTASQLGIWGACRGLLRPHDSGPEPKLVRALLDTVGPDADPAARGNLGALLDSSVPRIALLAAMRLLELSGESDEPGEWNERAEALVIAHDLRPAVILRAWWLENTGRFDDARRELLTRGQDPWGVAELMLLHARARDWPQAAKYARRVLAQPAGWSVRLLAAEALRSADHHDPDGTRVEGPSESFTAFDEMARDEHAPLTIRRTAYERLTSEAYRRTDLGRVRDLVEAWLEADPGNADPAWVLVRVLAISGRDRAAVAKIDELGLVPRLPDEFNLLSVLLPVVLEPAEAVSRLRKLAEANPEHAEELEGAALLTIHLSVATLPLELTQGLNFEAFMQRHPESKRFTPVSKEAFDRDFMDPNGPAHQRWAEANAFATGSVYGTDTAPTAGAAAALGKEVSAYWRDMASERGLPLSYGAPELHEAEVQSATCAIGNAVLFDASSIFVAASLPPDTSQLLRTVFPGALVTTSTLAAVAGTARAASRHGNARTSDVAVEPDAVRAVPGPADANAVLEFAQALETVADTDAANPQPEDSQFDASEEQLFGLAGTISVTKRLNLPLFSDDRDLRRQLRVDGQETFGTLALIDALGQGGYLTREAQIRARRTLGEELRGLGLRRTIDELVELGQEACWNLSEPLQRAALDLWSWRADGGETTRRWVAFLRSVHAEDPDSLGIWVRRVLDAFHRAVPGFPVADFAVHIAMFPLVPTSGSAAFFRALAHELEAALRSRPGNPRSIEVYFAAYLQYMQVLSQYVDIGQPNVLVLRGLTMLPLEHQPEVAHFLNWVWRRAKEDRGSEPPGPGVWKR